MNDGDRYHTENFYFAYTNRSWCCRTSTEIKSGSFTVVSVPAARAKLFCASVMTASCLIWATLQRQDAGAGRID